MWSLTILFLDCRWRSVTTGCEGVGKLRSLPTSKFTSGKVDALTVLLHRESTKCLKLLIFFLMFKEHRHGVMVINHFIMYFGNASRYLCLFSCIFSL